MVKLNSLMIAGTAALALFGSNHTLVFADSDQGMGRDNSVGVPELDFGEEGDLILRVFLRDILLADGMYSLIKDGDIFLPIGEFAELLDFPIRVDAINGTARGWYLQPDNTFDLDVASGTVKIKETNYDITDADYIADEFDIFVASRVLQQWLPLSLDVSLGSQVLTVRSPEKLPIEKARERSSKKVSSGVSYSSQKPFDIPSYRAIDWPEVTFSVGGFYAPSIEEMQYDYRVRAVGDIAFLSGKAGFSGDNNGISGGTVTLGRSDPRGMFGPLKVGDFEVGDTSQFLPGNIGRSLAGRGFRFSNKRLIDRRDLDTIDLQGEQQTGYEVELYVNSRLRGVDRDGSDNAYDFQDVPLQMGQNEIRLEFYGPQGQRFTETRRNFVGAGQGRAGDFDYEFAVVETGKKVFDLFDDFELKRVTGEPPNIKLSTALNMTYGLTRQTSVGLTIASLSPNDSPEGSEESGNQIYGSARLTTDLAGLLLSGDVTVDPNGNVASEAALRTSLGKYQVGMSQGFYARKFRDATSLGLDVADDLPKVHTSVNLTRQFFRMPGGRMSYGANTSYEQSHAGEYTASLGSRVDYQTSFVGLSWAHDLERASYLEEVGYSGKVGARLSAGGFTRWSLSSDLNYDDSGSQFFKTGSMRASRSFRSGGNVSVSGSRNLATLSNLYTASWGMQFRPFRLSASVSGTSADDFSVRAGLDMTARRYPKRWLPAISSTGGSGAVAVQVFADENGNGEHDEDEPVLEGVRLTRNGLLAKAETDSNGVALITGLSSGSSVDIGIVESDIEDPSLKFNGVKRGILPRPGRIPVIQVGLQRATDIEGTVTVAGETPAPNVRLILTPVGDGEPMEIYTEYDGYYYLAHVPLGVYDFGPDPEQLKSAGLTAQPLTRRLVLENLGDFPPAEDFNLIRLALSPEDNDSAPDVAAALSPDSKESIDGDVELPATFSDYRETGEAISGAKSDRNGWEGERSLAEAELTGIESAEWVMAQNGGDYTVQISSSVDREKLLDDASKIDSDQPPAFYVFKRTPSGRPVYGLSVGAYDTAWEALREIKKLPSEMKVYQPWVRKFEELQGEIERHR